VGAPYEVQIETDEISGCYPFIWIQIVNSALPPGLSMTQGGLISGVSTETGFTRFWLWNHDLTAAQTVRGVWRTQVERCASYRGSRSRRPVSLLPQRDVRSA
jgi:hypothetical protein